MKTYNFIFCLFVFFIGNVMAQQEKGITGEVNWLDSWANFSPNKESYREPTKILSGIIDTDTRLTKRNVYLLLGSVFVKRGVTLHIEPGTVILGDFESNGSLTIARDAKIIASGEETDPIIFTSSRDVKRAGDWGGLIILGSVSVSSSGYDRSSTVGYHSQLSPSYMDLVNYGGTDKNGSSGTLRYVRIEYAGKRVDRDRYFNGLLLGGVGNKTEVSYVMISNCAGNSFEVIGGNVDITKSVSFRSNMNDFEFSSGAQSVLYNSLAVRSPYVSSHYGSRCLKVSTYNTKGFYGPDNELTKVRAINVTFLNSSNDVDADISSGLIKEAIYVSESSFLDMTKSVISGFNPAVLFQETIKINQESLDKIKFSDMYFNNCKGNIFVEYNSNNEDLENWYGNSTFQNVYSKSTNEETFIDFNDEDLPDYRLRINKIQASQNYAKF